MSRTTVIWAYLPSRCPLARQLLLLIEGATVLTAIDGQDTSRAATDARGAAAALVHSATTAA